MVYTDKTKSALKIAYRAHKNQEDKGGFPYVFHPYEVASHMRTEDEVVVALLHDVLEDHPNFCSFSYIGKEFGEDVAKALGLLTRMEDEPYIDYINNLKTIK